MHINEYIELRKKELEVLKETFIGQNIIDPENWPLELENEFQWFDQEITFNMAFSSILQKAIGG